MREQPVMVAGGRGELLHAPRVLEVHQKSENLAVCEKDVERLHAWKDRRDEVAHRRRALRELALDLADAQPIAPVERLAVRGPILDRRAVPGEQRRIAARPPELVERLEIARDAAKRAAGLLGVLVDDRSE